MALLSTAQYSYRKRPNGSETATLKTYPRWINLSLLTELDGTSNVEESPWWKVSFEGGTYFYTDFETATLINEPFGFGGGIGGGIIDFPEGATRYTLIPTYSYAVSPWTGAVSARLISANTFISVGYVVSAEQVDATYWKITTKTGSLYYTTQSGAEACGVEIEVVPT